MPSVPLNLKAIAVKKKKNPLLSYIKLKQEVCTSTSSGRGSQSQQ